MISLSSSPGGVNKSKARLKKFLRGDLLGDLDRYGQQGVDALKAATPVDSSFTSQSWRYRKAKTRGGVSIEWYNTNVVNGTSIAILLQYGHATGTGGYVYGRDYINPAIKPIFDNINTDLRRRMKS